MTTIATPDADSAARQDLLERYARLAIRVGINLEPGREVAIRAKAGLDVIATAATTTPP